MEERGWRRVRAAGTGSGAPTTRIGVFACWRPEPTINSADDLPILAKDRDLRARRLCTLSAMRARCVPGAGGLTGNQLSDRFRGLDRELGQNAGVCVCGEDDAGVPG
jgi:hypothetical protein